MTLVNKAIRTWKKDENQGPDIYIIGIVVEKFTKTFYDHYYKVIFHEDCYLIRALLIGGLRHNKHQFIDAPIQNTIKELSDNELEDVFNECTRQFEEANPEFKRKP